MQRLACFALLFGLLTFTGCAGYRLGPTNGEQAGAHSVQVNPFVNKTLTPWLSDYVNISMRKNIQQDGTYRVNTHDDGDILLSGVITAYTRSELSFQLNDVITVQDYEIRLTANVIARERSTGKIIFDRPITGRTTLRAGKDLTAAERQAIPLMTDDLAKKTTALLVDGTW